MAVIESAVLKRIKKKSRSPLPFYAIFYVVEYQKIVLFFSYARQKVATQCVILKSASLNEKNPGFEERKTKETDLRMRYVRIRAAAAK